MDKEDDLEVFRIPGEKLPLLRKSTAGKKKRGAFIRGPILLDWLDGVLKLPGRAPLVVAMALAYQSGLEQSSTVRFTRKLMIRFGIPIRTCHHVLVIMESAGLVTVTNLPGRCRVVDCSKMRRLYGPDEGYQT